LQKDVDGNRESWYYVSMMMTEGTKMSDDMMVEMDLSMCERCGEAPMHIWNDDHAQAVCESCQAYYDKHICAGDNCVCIGGNDNLDLQE